MFQATAQSSKTSRGRTPCGPLQESMAGLAHCFPQDPEEFGDGPDRPYDDFEIKF